MPKSYLIINKTTNEILSLSPEDDAQLPDDTFKKIILNENYWNIILSEHPTMYKYENNEFVKNIEKIDNIATEKREAEEKSVEGKLVWVRMRKIAKAELVAEGIVFKHI